MMKITRMMSSSTAFKMSGFSLAELMVGMVIGLIVTLIITNVIVKFDAQQRATTGTSDAQTNGSIAMYQIQHDAQSAGFALPVYGTDYLAYNCPAATLFDHDAIAATPNVGLSPITIDDGGVGGSDVIHIQYGDSSFGGAVMPMQDLSAGSVIRVANNMACKIGDLALTMSGSLDAPNCVVSKVTAVSAVGTPNPTITLADAVNIASGNQVSCLGNWMTFAYSVVNNQLVRNGEAIVSDIVDLQAQYGISLSGSDNTIERWVNASGATWATPSTANRNRIKAIRVAVVARNGQMSSTAITQKCSAEDSANPTGLCAWEGTAASPAPEIDLNAAGVADWQNYRYRVYETIIPIKNVIFSRENAV